MNKWWGYVHTNGSLHVKRFFSDADMQEAMESHFVRSIHGPWECKDREEAEKKLKSAVEVSK